MGSNKRIFRGERLRALREQHNLTQDELSDLLGFSYSQMNRYENGKTEPMPDAIVKIANHFKVSTDYLLGLVDNPNDHLQSEALTPNELKLLSAFRRGNLRDVVRIATEEPAPESQ